MSSIGRNIKAYRTGLAIRVNRGVRAVCGRILSESNELIPKDTKAAVSSGGIRMEIQSSGFAKGIVGYGGQDEVYSGMYSVKEHRFVTRRPSTYIVIVHEDATLTHNKGETAGFLRIAARNHDANIAVLNKEILT